MTTPVIDLASIPKWLFSIAVLLVAIVLVYSMRVATCRTEMFSMGFGPSIPCDAVGGGLGKTSNLTPTQAAKWKEASSDGFVIVVLERQATTQVQVEVDGKDGPRVVARLEGQSDLSTSATVPIASGDKWKVTLDASPPKVEVFWIPLGAKKMVADPDVGQPPKS